MVYVRNLIMVNKFSLKHFADNLNKYVLEVADFAMDVLLQSLPQPYQGEIKVKRRTAFC